ncbi:MAG: hypothetical protein B7Y56_12395 [Gallionellales bacterium 35-53-114]|jgi:hypothetical protein|nr:MAG: hypothetical protein B7Y56_12395 [Gallionellales bacterium 35-53-114]OYZ63405.1 MAG: hypothetical protein B7Y04_08610 [Gallionellales bacterium 24-53-125]OZB10982.1 MAG: hypothetical protein B7X61_01080 [Gallionellales bacterium 39-52-133]
MIEIAYFIYGCRKVMLMEKPPLFCKSYHRDVLRAKRLVDSIEVHNADYLPLFVSVPAADIALFKNKIGTQRCIWVADEDIISANPQLSPEAFSKVDGRLAQQVIKSEFWRLQSCATYLCLDSDSVFIRDFYLSNFITADGVPYTTLHQCKEFMQLAVNQGKMQVVRNFNRDSACGRKLFARCGPEYDFGPTPVMWSSRVWQDLTINFLEPRGWSLLDAIQHFPAELRWYGEALLAYKSIPLHPVEPLFRVYHADWQYYSQRKAGETIAKLREQYLGVVIQSNWEYELDHGALQKTLLSRAARNLRRQLSRLG